MDRTHCSQQEMSRSTTASMLAEHTITIALAGQPNVGKSSVFNALTGLAQHVGNWTGKTVEQKTGWVRRNGRILEFVDLPGTYALTANSLEEQIARDFILQQRPAAVVAVVNAASLERSLYLVSELLELPSPVIVALNMMDVAEGEGLRIKPEVLEAMLGIPVVPMVAARGQGIDELLSAIEKVIAGSGDYRPRQPELSTEIERSIAELEALLVKVEDSGYPRRWLALKLLEGDGQVAEVVRPQMDAEHWQAIEALLREHEEAVLPIASARYQWIGQAVRAALFRRQAGAVSLTERLDRVATHPAWGSLLLIALLGLVTVLVYHLAQPLVGLVDMAIGAVATLLRNTLTGVPPLLVSFLTEGLLGGVSAVLALVPILALYFLAIGFLEDVGYLARAAFVADRLMHRIGLHGRSFLPLFLGLGCNVPAVLGTRILSSRRERLLTMMLAPLVPCAARMAVLLFVAGALFGSNGPFVVLGLLALISLALALTGLLFSRTVLAGENPPFVMELPLYHLPNWRVITLNAWQRIAEFATRAGTVILAASALVWLLAAWPGGSIEQSLLAQIGRALAPLGRLMGLDWRLMVALLASIVAKEQAVATLAVLAAVEEATLAQTLPQMVTPAGGLAFLAVQMLFVPCIGTLSALRHETGSWRWTLLNTTYLAVISVTAGILLYHTATLVGLGG